MKIKYPLLCVSIVFLCVAFCTLSAAMARAQTKTTADQPSPAVTATAAPGKVETSAVSATADPDKNRQPSLAWGNELYGHYCIPCHGIRGNGHGFNASHLLVKPANHTDAAFMSKRSDQKLFDTINLGGVEVAKSTLMPPWGAALDNDNKIKSLIMKLRDLCQCRATKNW